MFIQNESFNKYFKDIENEFFSRFKAIEKINYLNNSYHEADPVSRSLVDMMIKRLLKGSSTIVGIQNILELYEKSKSGRSSVILMEHYSNFDFPCFQFLLNEMNYKEVAEHIVPVAGVKLFQESLFVKTLSLGYSVIFIYPPHSFIGVDREKVRKRRAFNANSMRYIVNKKTSGYIVLVFPTATRYRKGRPETKKIISGILGYFKIFDYFIMVSVNGNILEVSPNEDMSCDIFKEDTVVYNATEVMDIFEYKNLILEKLNQEGLEPTKELLGSSIADDLEKRFEVLHEKGTKIYNGLN
ncbi:1-acyl-sn-glycerol-3-phosphate acyltransferase [Borrelia miyamotoi]|uniref:1-acyl-sn-glycerol-3-phosphate acyltransferase n=1 Tax=Borrelia miyamotoi TaxID=47466 RepID=A0AAX3JME5_9SPIR|nr:1-acyl-sn-glycerol-3-phosphate acyltransferase [Borrelia miyamotoi]QFP41997.1 1-acyl-sn-glycerol-3-phosphate acyltransferase [Borrelia miyamotoi]QFP48113.1 1-acyl-sn-glycerol-3-phosphate acyltransferase [Borrelia miyamotoi]QGT55872.1 1-acyl-sn-glycerol-3-phosphate acyltransferase [Borrelia miyamotoi]QGT56652.1 1-acyl-sn-glycerol-3-phosphate acyltransferase [Borrelia miyamotoi]WAZ71913.1 1-acyl-sn-glycerol-3-phosphate acyltransferase [Borrelia miyamotoi]